MRAVNVALALTMLALHAPPPAGVVVHQQACPDYAAVHVSCAHPAEGAVYMDPALKREGPWPWRYALAHELGHIWDYQRLDDPARARYAAMIYKPGMAWLSEEGEAELQADLFATVPPGEQFADTYALCAMGPRYRRWALRVGGYVAGYGESVRPKVVASTCWLLRHPPGE